MVNSYKNADTNVVNLESIPLNLNATVFYMTSYGLGFDDVC